MARYLVLLTASLLLLVPFGCAPAQRGETSLDTKIGQMLMVGFRGMQIEEEGPFAKDVKKYHLGGVVLFDYDVPRDTAYRNISSPSQVKKLTADLQKLSNIPLFISIDQEGGKVNRLKSRYGFPPSVSAEQLGRINDPDTTRIQARRTARQLSRLGINTNLAPVVDLNINPDNPIIGGIGRSFSPDPQIVSRHAMTYIRTVHSYGIITTLKHFPGHGSSIGDSHLGVVDVTHTWSRKELIPYRNIIQNGLADMVMTAHIFNARLDPTYPATLSKPTIEGILRDSLHFEGVVMSDDLQMKAIRSEYGLKETIRQAIRAGVDILVFANNTIYDPAIAQKAHSTIKELLEKGVITPNRIEQSYNRIMALKEEYLIKEP